MTDWKENMRRIQDAARREDGFKQAQANSRQIQEQLRLQKEAELRSAAERQDERNRLKYFEVLDDIGAREMLEGINQQVWRGRGNVTEESGDAEKFVRLSFEYQTTVSEIKTKEWEVKVGTGSEIVCRGEQGGTSETYDIMEKRSKNKVVKEYKVVKPSYLEVGVVDYHENFASLYIVDAEVELSTSRDKAFGDLARKAGGIALGKSRTIEYKDTNGNIFDKKPHDNEFIATGSVLMGYLSLGEYFKPTTYSYSLDNGHQADKEHVVLRLEPDIRALKNFVTYGLALSCSLRTAQGKLPFQLK